MARSLAAAALLLFASTGLGSSTEERPERPHVIVHKHFELKAGQPDGFLVKGSAFKVVYTVLNLGLEEAVEVRVKDEWTPSQFDTLAGEASASWARLDGGANKTFSVELRPRVAGLMQPARASVDYQYTRKHEGSAGAEDDDDEEEEDVVEVTGYSTAPWGGRVIEIVTEARFREMTASARIPAAVAAVGAASLLAFHYLGWARAKGASAATAA